MSLNAHVGIPFVQTTKHMFGTALMVVSGLVVGKCFFGFISICVKQKKKEEEIHLGKGGGKTSTGLFWPKTIRPWHNFLIYGAVNSNGNLAMCLFQQIRLH